MTRSSFPSIITLGERNGRDDQKRIDTLGVETGGTGWGGDQKRSTTATTTRMPSTRPTTMKFRRGGTGNAGLRFLSALLALGAAAMAVPSIAAAADPSAAVLEGAVRVAKVENDQVRRALLQSFGSPLFGAPASQSSAVYGDSILDLMRMGQAMMPKAVDNTKGAVPFTMPGALDPAFFKDALASGSQLAKQACDPLVLNSMSSGLGSLMFPAGAKDALAGFCAMLPKSSAAAASPLAGLAGMLGPQLVGGPLANFNSLGASLPVAASPLAAEAVEVEAVEVEAPVVKVAKPANSSAGNATETSSTSVVSAAVADPFEEDRESMDYIEPVVPSTNALGFPDLSEMMNFGEIFALEEELPDMLDHLIDDAWEELGTEEQAYTAKHGTPPPLPAAYVNVEPVNPHPMPARSASLPIEEVDFEIDFGGAGSLDEDAFSSLFDTVALVAKSNRGDDGNKAAAAGGEVKETEETEEAADAGEFWEDDYSIVDVSEEEISRQKYNERKDIIIALSVCGGFVALVAVSVSAVSAFKFCSNSLNERRYHQEYDDDLPSSRKFLSPLFSGRSQRSDTEVV